MSDILTRLYYFVDEYLPNVQYPDDAQQALEATLTPEQEALFEAYQMEAFRRDDSERRILFNYMLRLGWYVPVKDTRTPPRTAGPKRPWRPHKTHPACASPYRWKARCRPK